MVCLERSVVMGLRNVNEGIVSDWEVGVGVSLRFRQPFSEARDAEYTFLLNFS